MDHCDICLLKDVLRSGKYVRYCRKTEDVWSDLCRFCIHLIYIIFYPVIKLYPQF